MGGPGIGGPSGDLFDADMGDGVTRGNVQFDYDGTPGRTHHSIIGDGRHFSWDDVDSDPLSPNNTIHGTDHGDHGHW